MKLLALSIGAFGAVQAFLWFWAPRVARWQMASALERYQASESLEVAMQTFRESMRSTFIEAGIVGGLMLLSCCLILAHKRMGWNLWLVCLCVASVGAIFSAVLSGFSAALVLRVILLASFVAATVSAHQSKVVTGWFSGEQRA